MAPSETVSATQEKPISTIVIIIAMQTEALPLVNSLQLVEDKNPVFPRGVPWVRYVGSYKDLQINLIWPGKDSLFGVDSVGTVSASLVTYASFQALNPDLIINAGTAGGFKAKGANIGDVFIATDVAFHDRRIPIPVFDQYGIGARKTFSTPNLLKEFDLKAGKLSTGDSLDMSTYDEAAILANDATIKDMEVSLMSEIKALNQTALSEYLRHSSLVARAYFGPSTIYSRTSFSNPLSSLFLQFLVEHKLALVMIFWDLGSAGTKTAPSS